MGALPRESKSKRSVRDHRSIQHCHWASEMFRVSGTAHRETSDEMTGKHRQFLFVAQSTKTQFLSRARASGWVVRFIISGCQAETCVLRASCGHECNITGATLITIVSIYRPRRGTEQHAEPQDLSNRGIINIEPQDCCISLLTICRNK